MFKFVRLRFEAKVTEAGLMPRFFGPTLRGALGLNFRRMVCVTHLDECQPCILRFQCPYAKFFEPFAPNDHPFANRFHQMPRPFAIQVPPPADEPVSFREGEKLVFGMTIWQHADSLLPYIIIAIQKTLEKGVGKGLRASLERVLAKSRKGEKVVFRSDSGVLSTELPWFGFDEISSPSASPVKRLTVRFVTPVRIELGNKLQNPVDFHALVKSANERGRALFWAYERTEPPWNGKGLIESAKSVLTVESQQQWLDLSRFSRRQGERLKIGGVVGWATFEGEGMESFLPLLRLMEIVHVGKLATMGLGQIELDYNATL